MLMIKRISFIAAASVMLAAAVVRSEKLFNNRKRNAVAKVKDLVELAQLIMPCRRKCLEPFFVLTKGGPCFEPGQVGGASPTGGFPEIVIEGTGTTRGAAKDLFVVTSIIVEARAEVQDQCYYRFLHIDSLDVDGARFDINSVNLLSEYAWRNDEPKLDKTYDQESVDLMGAPVALERRPDTAPQDTTPLDEIATGGSFPHQLNAVNRGERDIVVTLHCGVKCHDFVLNIDKIRVNGYKYWDTVIKVKYNYF